MMKGKKMEKEERKQLVDEIRERREEMFEKWEVERKAEDLVLRFKVGGNEEKITVSMTVRRAKAGYRCAYYIWELRTQRDVAVFWNQLQGVEDSLCSLDKVPY